MDKLTAFEKSLIDKGLEEVIEIFKKESQDENILDNF